MYPEKRIKAAVIIIGNEILSGRISDSNLHYISQKLSEKGIYVEEARIIPDKRSYIIDAVLFLSKTYDYVLTTGGIGPTHDDITTESVAAAFDKKILLNSEAKQALVNYYKTTNLNDARLKMACLPEGSMLIPNPISGAPGFIINNVYVMAGVPAIMQAMLMNILPLLKQGNQIISETLTIVGGESKIAHTLSNIQLMHPNIDIGSYPRSEKNQHIVTIVFRGTDMQKIKAALEITKASFEKLDVKILN